MLQNIPVVYLLSKALILSVVADVPKARPYIGMLSVL